MPEKELTTAMSSLSIQHENTGGKILALLGEMENVRRKTGTCWDKAIIAEIYTLLGLIRRLRRYEKERFYQVVLTSLST